MLATIKATQSKVYLIGNTMARYPTLKQAVAHCKKYKDTCDMFEIWEEWHDCEPSRYGGYSIGDVNSQIVHQYKGGKLVGKDTLL